MFTGTVATLPRAPFTTAISHCDRPDPCDHHHPYCFASPTVAATMPFHYLGAFAIAASLRGCQHTLWHCSVIPHRLPDKFGRPQRTRRPGVVTTPYTRRQPPNADKRSHLLDEPAVRGTSLPPLVGLLPSVSFSIDGFASGVAFS